MRGWWLGLWLATLLGGAGCVSPAVGFGVEITATFEPSVSDTDLKSVTSLVINASGDETFTKTIALKTSPPRVERFIYRPLSSTRHITIIMQALDANEQVVAEGSTGMLTLTAAQTLAVPITLVPPMLTDLGMPDFTTIDEGNTEAGTIEDAAAGPDASTPIIPAFYVAPQGSDSNAGTLTAPFATLARAQLALQASTTIKTVYLRSGIYPMTTTLTLTSADNGEVWSSYPPDGYDSAILDGGASSPTTGINLLTILGATNITIDGLTLRNFQQWGIGLHGGAASAMDGFTQSVATCDSVLIENNVMDTGYTSNNGGFAGGGLWAFGNVTNLTVANNLVTNQNGGGIRVHSPFGSTGGPVSGLVIKNNVVLNTNRVPVDNGAIFVEDPSFSSTSIVIENNFVRDYQGGGTSPARDVGIYLDHGASNVTITGNIIGNTANAIVGNSSTASTQALVLGSSHNVTVTSNIIDLGTGALILSLAYDYFATTDTPMTGNVISGNIFIGKWSGIQESYAFGVGPYGFAAAGTDVTKPTITHNLYYNYGTGTLGTTGNGLSDAAPVTGIDPMLSGTTYTLASTSPAYTAPISFAPIAGGWGPPGYVIPSTGTSPSY